MKIIEKKHRLQTEYYMGQTTVAFTACLDHNRYPVVDDKIVRMAIDILTHAVTKNHCIVPCYCFMPDHLHVIIMGINEKACVWQALVEFKQKTGYWMSKNRPDISWQKDFFDHVIRPEEDLGTQVRYILDNPVRKRLVETWREYPYSGAIDCTLEDVLYGIL
ncbi:MAG: transposase [Candidatus Omnitrophica bacterium]|nr:transposase [Candidatus Omnitrophota bacterium]